MWLGWGSEEICAVFLEKCPSETRRWVENINICIRETKTEDGGSKHL
jgi:hypothetical protein